MGWSFGVQLLRKPPLNTDERATLLRVARQVAAWPWESEGLDLEVPRGKRSDGLVGRAVVKVPYDLEDEGDAQRVLDAVHAFVDAVAGLSARVDDDLDTVTVTDGRFELGGGEAPQPLLDEGDETGDGGDWEPLIQPLPATLPPKLVAALALLDEAETATPPEETKARKAWDKKVAAARKAAGSDANVGKLLVLLDEDTLPKPVRAAARDSLRHAAANTVARVGLKRYAKLGTHGRWAVNDTLRALDEISEAAAVFLAVWSKGKGRYHWGDFVGPMPEEVLQRFARVPEVTARLQADLLEARDDMGDEALCRRGSEAAELLGRAQTRAGAKALAETLVWERKAYVGREFTGHTLTGVYQGLAWTVLSAGEPEPGFEPPMALLRRQFFRMSRNNHTLRESVFTALAAGDPGATLPWFTRLFDSDTYTRELIPALTHMPGDEAEALLLQAMCAAKKTLRDRARGAWLKRKGLAGMPVWVASQLSEDEPDLCAPWSLDVGELDRASLPRDEAGWRAWFAERGWALADAPSLPQEELLMRAEVHRGYSGLSDAWRAALLETKAAGDWRYAQALVVGAARFAAKTREDAFDWADPDGLDLRDLAGLSLSEQLAWLDAKADLPTQLQPALVRVHAGPGLAERLSVTSVEDDPPGEAERLKARDLAWLASVDVEAPARW